MCNVYIMHFYFLPRLYLTRYMAFSKIYSYNQKRGNYTQKPKSLVVVGRGELDFSFLFKSCEIYRSQGRQEFYESTVGPAIISHNSTSLVYF